MAKRAWRPAELARAETLDGTLITCDARLAATAGHDAWFRNEVERGIREADDPAVDRVPHDRVLSGWRQQRAELERRAAGRTA